MTGDAALGGDRDDSLDQAAQRAAAQGFTVVSASGNDGGDSCAMSPGADPAAISVAAVDKEDQLATYSNRGTCTDLLAPAPGANEEYDPHVWFDVGLWEQVSRTIAAS